MSAAKKRNAPTLIERTEALKEEVSDELDRICEQRRCREEGRAVPAATLRAHYMAKGGGSVFEAYLAAVKEGS